MSGRLDLSVVWGTTYRARFVVFDRTVPSSGPGAGVPVDTPWGLTGLVFDAMLLGDRWEVIRQVPLSIVDGAIILELDAEATGALVPNSHYWWYLNVVRLSGDVQRLLQGEVVVSP